MNSRNGRAILAAVVFALLAAGAPLLHADDAAKATYDKKCANCHGPDGSGNTAMGKKFAVRDLGSPDVQKQSDSELTDYVVKGKKQMPPYGSSLKPDDIKGLVAYIRTFAKK